MKICAKILIILFVVSFFGCNHFSGGPAAPDFNDRMKTTPYKRGWWNRIVKEEVRPAPQDEVAQLSNWLSLFLSLNIW